ncbi:MAG: DUF805 domain-containing protein [Alphaproteobacteria bacterium]|nr:DUF805 domain-containing protein [Alphaproteobacteria bacterium]
MPTKKSKNTKTVKTVRKPAARRVATPAAVPAKPKMVSFGRAVRNFFAKYFQFSGTATRAEYWWAFLFMVLTVLFLVVVMSYVVSGMGNPGDLQANAKLKALVLLPVALFYVITIVPWYSLMARRLHDVGITARLLWISVIFSLYSFLVPNIIHEVPVVRYLSLMWTFLLFLIFLFPSKRENNPYRD